MIAQTLDLSIDQGSTFTLPIVLSDPVSGNPIDLTGYTAKAWVKLSYSDTTPFIVFSATIPTPTNGTVILSLTSTQTILTTPNIPGLVDSVVKCVWDLFLNQSGAETRILKGKISFLASVTTP